MRKFQVTVNGNTYEVEVQEVGQGSSFVATQPAVAQTPVAVPAAPTAPVTSIDNEGANKVGAPMPGKIVDVKVTVGQTIKEGDLVAVLEAMKMENEIFATASGTVASVNVSAGQMVEANDIIISIN